MESSDRPGRSSLLGAQLRWLIRESGIAGDTVAVDCPLGAAALAGSRIWILRDEATPASLGASLLWAAKVGAESIGIVARSEAGALARRAALFDTDVEVRRLVGDSLVTAEPDPHADPPAPPASHLAIADAIVAAGATLGTETFAVGDGRLEHVVVGEVWGLEVCRVAGEDEVRIEIGIGAHDRETFALLHAGRDPGDALAEVVATVAAHRAPGAPTHRLNRIAVSRLARARAEHEPRLVGAASVTSVHPTVPRSNLSDEVPCAAVSDTDALTFVSGVDPEAVPAAVDLADRHGLAARIVLRERDDHGAHRRLALLARRPPVFTHLEP